MLRNTGTKKGGGGWGGVGQSEGKETKTAEN